MMKSILFVALLILIGNLGFAQDNSEDNTVRVLTFNILHGATTKGNFDLDKIASVINEVKPDLVALQEVDFKTKRAKEYDLATELGLRTKMASIFGPAMPYDGGWYGEAVLTKMPIISSRNIPLPHSPKNEPRAALEVLVQLNSGDTIAFIGTHLEHQKNSPDRIDQVKKLNNVFTKNNYPTILGGDLNATPESEPISILKEFWNDCFDYKAEPTYPSDNPRSKIDYIMFRPANKWEIIENKIICDTIASDHCAVLSILKLKK